MKETFTQFLMGKFMTVEPQILDDDLPDAFEDWKSNSLEVDDVIEYANEFFEKLTN